MKIEIALIEDTEGDVLKESETAYITFVGNKKLVELAKGFFELKWNKYHGDKYKIG